MKLEYSYFPVPCIARGDSFPNWVCFTTKHFITVISLDKILSFSDKYVYYVFLCQIGHTFWTVDWEMWLSFLLEVKYRSTFLINSNKLALGG